MKKIIGLLTTFVLLLSLTVTAFATDYNVDWTVEYNGSELTSTFDKAKVDNALSQLMPGDSAILTVTLKNSGSKKTDFWMSNEVLKNFDGDEDEAGGAYTYKLTYNGTVLYDDDTVGGENPNADGTAGLMEATEALKDFFYLDTLSPGQTGTVVLIITPDGPTFRNAYQDAIARINLNFAVEEQAENTTIIKTGDTSNALPFFIGAGVAGVAIIVLAVIRVRKNRKGGAKA